jgi:hypothetical protein
MNENTPDSPLSTSADLGLGWGSIKGERKKESAYVTNP